MFNDPHFRERKLFERVEINGKPLDIPAMVPKFSDTPGSTEWPGAELGSHNREVLQNLLNLSDQQIAELQQQEVI